MLLLLFIVQATERNFPSVDPIVLECLPMFLNYTNFETRGPDRFAIYIGTMQKLLGIVRGVSGGSARRCAYAWCFPADHFKFSKRDLQEGKNFITKLVEGYKPYENSLPLYTNFLKKLYRTVIKGTTYTFCQYVEDDKIQQIVDAFFQQKEDQELAKKTSARDAFDARLDARKKSRYQTVVEGTTYTFGQYVEDDKIQQIVDVFFQQKEDQELAKETKARDAFNARLPE